MAKCNDYWCEHYDKYKGNCAKCIKDEEAKDKDDLSVILKERAVRQMELNKKRKTIVQNR